MNALAPDTRKELLMPSKNTTKAHNFIDLAGQRFGRLTVIERAPNLRPKVTRWLCRCDCGTEISVVSRYLITGDTRSCGCLKIEQLQERLTKHGSARKGKKTAEYNTLRVMMDRCHNPVSTSYPRYGGRGIFVCDRWRESFENFLADMGPRPSPEHSIDRIDNDGPYSPDNCRWATDVEQANNKRNNHRLEYAGRKQTIAEWARELGMSDRVIRSRIRYGWSDERILTEPIHSRYSR